MRTATYYLEGRYAVTIECADDLTPAERTGMEEWFRKEVGFLQRVDGPPLFTAAQERAFAAALAAMDRPRKLSEKIVITPGFRDRFPAACEIGRERHGENYMHVYFDNGREVGCWSVYGDGSQEGEILGAAEAAAVRESCRREKLTDG
jgi:hypothetical protein